MPKLTDLSKKERAFCEAYIANGCNATKAYMEAYGASHEVADKISYKLMKRERVREYIKKLQVDAYEAALINAERVALKLADIAFAEKDDEYYPASAQLKALDLLQKQLGLQKQQIQADINTDIVINIGE